MTDRFDDTTRLQRMLARVRQMAHAVGGWLGPVLFAGALAIGLVLSGIWLRFHPVAALRTSASETALVLDPVHKPLPTPLGGSAAGAPVDTAPPPQPDAAEGSPDATVQPMPEATPADESQPIAEITPTPSSDIRAPAGERGDRESVGSGDGDTAPSVIARTEPEYPVEALPEHAQGMVRLHVSIDAEGGVEEVRVIGSSGSNVLDTAAVQSVRAWHYKPAMHAGKPLAGALDVAVNFTLAEER